MLKTQTFIASIPDLQAGHENDLVTGFDPGTGEEGEIYPTLIDDVVADFAESIQNEGGVVMQIMAIVQKEKIIMILTYDDKPQPAQNSNLHVPL